jgi:tetratricopeptide (TPR) repeat protein/Cdc6-like AAA superfamily ATPase
MSYFPLAEIIVVLLIFGILFLLSRIKVTAADPPKTPEAETRKGEEEEIDDADDTAEPAKKSTFFPDKPSRRDYLDFKAYAEPLADLISRESTQTPLTVGLFGAWGSGKTTLMRMIERSLKKIQNQPDSIQFVLVSFEAWKYYKEDALWRAMLLKVLATLRTIAEKESNQELKSEIEHLEQSLYRDVEWEEKGGLTIDWPKLAKAGAGGALKLSFSLVPGMSTIMEAVKVVDKSLGEGDISEHIGAVSDAFQRNMVTHHQLQLRNMEQFQREFFNLVQKHFKNQRLVIFVDDLDRCLPEKAIEVLEAIKLFLDVEGCVFILGIDQEVVARGLKAKYKDAGFLENEQSLAFSVHYIEKLIQLPFHLPPIEADEVQAYINALNVDWPDPKCAQIFAQGLSPNPRQIKRTINVYMLLWSLAKQRQDNLKAVTELRLAKVVILQTAYPDVFDRLKSDAPLLQQLERLSCQEGSSLADDKNIDSFLIEALKQSSLKKLFQLLADEELASFAGLAPHELTSLFSLARKAPLVSETIIREAPPTAPITTAEPASGPAGRSGDRPFQVRAPVRDFVGRVAQLARMTTALRGETSIGVVTGMPGTGKTEFALLVAERLRADYPDGHLFVDMHGDEKPIEVAEALSACLRAFGVNPGDLKDDELVAAYRSQLNGKRVLVLLDNAANATQVTPLIPPQGSAILITSHNSLIIPGMVSIPLDQLSPADALTLFMNISSRVPENIAAEICKLCGYLPLAIRAAASTLEVTTDLDPAVYVDQLRDEQKRLELLRTDDSTGTLAKSLEASFNLSYSLLTEPVKTVFRKLAVFPESFDAKAEEFICEDPDHAHLSELLKFGLALYDTQAGRYRVHPLLRLFAQRYLEEAERESVTRNLARHYLIVVKDADALYSKGGDSLIEGLATYDREQINIDAGFTWSKSQPPSDLEAASICSDYPRYCSQFLLLRKSPRERIAWFTPALEASKRVSNINSTMAHLIDLGSAYSSLGESQMAIDFYTEALGIAGPLNASQIELLIHRNLGLLYRGMSNANEAMNHFEQQLELSQRLRNARGESEALVNLANLLFATGRTADAIENFNRAAAISRGISDLPGEAMALGNLGRAYSNLGDTGRAIQFYHQQLEISQNKLGDRLGEAAVRFNLALTLKQIGKLNEAREEAGTALRIFDELESPNARHVQDWLAKLPAGE